MWDGSIGMAIIEAIRFLVQGVKKVPASPSDLNIYPIKRNHFILIQEDTLPYVQ
jgi:hypothetical protein